ncbi:MAG: hypothetical protein OEY49_00015 [Candidatus Heimdallarchaeota archaeon]|nr:hypothetical protein [Candidatus Heimdallarchaeota archaeon]
MLEVKGTFRLSTTKFKLPWLPLLRRPQFIFYRIKISIPKKIPVSLIYTIILLGVLFVFSGGVYDWVDQPYARGADANGNPLLIMREQDRQFILEGLVAGIVMFMGALGLYMLGQATTDPHNVGRATSYQTIGIILIVLSFIIIQRMFACKTDKEC